GRTGHLRPGRNLMPLTWVLAALVAMGDSAPRITLGQALARATRLDPNYVSALGQVANAQWSRRSIRSTFVLPSLTLSNDYANYWDAIVSTVGGVPARSISIFQANARYDIFTGGRKTGDRSRTDAELESAEAGEVQARFATALRTESDYYAVLSGRELRDVA